MPHLLVEFGPIRYLLVELSTNEQPVGWNLELNSLQLCHLAMDFGTKSFLCVYSFLDCHFSNCYITNNSDYFEIGETKRFDAIVFGMPNFMSDKVSIDKMWNNCTSKSIYIILLTSSKQPNLRIPNPQYFVYLLDQQ